MKDLGLCEMGAGLCQCLRSREGTLEARGREMERRGERSWVGYIIRKGAVCARYFGW